MPQATLEDLAWAQSGTKPINAVRWSFDKARIVRSKKRAGELMMVWKKWYERHGWEVRGRGGDGYVATSPDGNTKHACALRRYDPKTLAALE